MLGKKENWETLWEDLMSLYNNEVQGYYFLGPIVTQAIFGTADGISPFIVIDGQQRLTTLSIILAALKNYLKKSDKQMAEEVHECYLVNKYKKGDDLYKSNYIFMKLPSEERDSIYQNKWLPLQESFKNAMKTKEYVDELTNAFWFYLRKDGQAVNQKSVLISITKNQHPV
jgi:uncharacterized protein with ParB-like and HNH nuclease domain